MYKKNLLICGSTGFIGRNLAEHFAQIGEYNVFGTYFNSTPNHNPPIELIRADLTNKKDVEAALCDKDIVIQTAAVTSGVKDIITRPHIHMAPNAIMNALILSTAYENKISHVIFPSCTIMYQSSHAPVKEIDLDTNAPITPAYFGAGWTKIYSEKLCEFFSRRGETKFTVMRQSNIYGPYDKFDLERSHVMGATITKVMSAQKTVKVWGTGEEERDLLYISDLVDFVDAVLQKQKSRFELYNVGLGVSISVSDLVKKVIQHAGKCLELEYDASKPTIKTKIALDCTKAKKELDWEPKLSLDEGIKKTIDWYEKQTR